MKTPAICAALLLASNIAGAQTAQWTVEITPTFTPLPIGTCGAVHLRVRDMVARAPARNPQGYLVSMADFDMTVSGPGAAGYYIDTAHYQVCSCLGAVKGSTPTITATYPAKALPAASRVPGLAIEESVNFTIGKQPESASNPPSCAALAAIPVSQLAAGQSPGARGPRVAASTPSASPPPPAPSTNPAAPTAAAAVPTGQPIAVQPTTRTPGSIVPAPASAPAPPAAAAPVPVNPSGLESVQSGPGQVGLTWNPVPEASFYVVFGPGLTPGGHRVENKTDPRYNGLPIPPKVLVIANNVPAGMQEWLVASYYSPGNISTPSSQYSKASVNVTAPEPVTPPATSTPAATPVPASGKYLVTATGFRAYQASMDDFLSRDGVGDEVYAAVYVRRYDQRTSQLVDAGMRQSAAYGDVFHFGDQRLQAGSRSQTGGIQDGDPIPDGPLIAMRSVAAQDAIFPLRLWEGTLTDGVDTLILSPSLWEQDGGDNYYAQWAQFQQGLNISMFTKPGVQNEMAQKEFRSLVFGMSGNSTGGVGQAFSRIYADIGMVFGGGLPIVGLLSTSADRPLGLVDNGPDKTALPNHTVVLTREIIEAALARPALGIIPSPRAGAAVVTSGSVGTPAMATIGTTAPKPGIIVIHFQDATGVAGVVFPERPAIYQMYIQVERVP